MSENKGPASRRPRVVYVDDEPFVLNAFRRMVSISGFEPITFATPGEALAWLARALPVMRCGGDKIGARLLLWTLCGRNAVAKSG